MIKVMNLDMFYFEYKPVFSENEKVIFTNNQMEVSFQSNVKPLKDVEISNIKLDTLFAERIGQDWSNDEILNSLKSINSDDKKEKDKYRLCFINPEDEISVSYDFMIKSLTKLKYEGKSFEYIAYAN